MSEFLQMGGYAAYVWSAYGITLIVLVVNIWAAFRSHTGALVRIHRENRPERSGRQPTVRQIT